MVLAILVDTLFLCLLLTLFAFQAPATLFSATVTCGIYAVMRARPLLLDKDGLALVLTVILILITVAVIRNDQEISAIFHALSTGLVLYAASRFASLPLAHVRRCLEITFWLYVFGVVCGLAAYWGQPEPLGQIIRGASTNGLPTYLIVLQIALSIAVFLERGRWPLLSTLATLSVAVFGVGRGSIIVSLLILMVSCFGNAWRWMKDRNGCAPIRMLLPATVIATIAIAGLSLNSQDLMELVRHTKWGWGLFDPPRARMIGDYLEKMEFLSVVVGANYTGTAIDEFYGGNPHNSYIRLHSLFGLPGILLVISFPLAIFLSNRDIRTRFAIGVMVLLALVRAITEPIFFATVLDFFYFLYFFLFWRYAPVRECRDKECRASKTELARTLGSIASQGESEVTDDLS